MKVKIYLWAALVGLVIAPAASSAKDMTLQERLENVRAARALFFELDDIYRSYKREFSEKNKNKIKSDKKKISVIHDKLNDLPTNTPGGAGDIIYDCRDVYGFIYVWIEDIAGEETYSFIPRDLNFRVTEEYKQNLRREREEDFIVMNARCINLMNEKEQEFLKQLVKK